MNKSVVTALKVVLGAVMTALLAAQVWLSPVTAGEMANQYPEFASLKIPLLVLLEVALLCVQAFLVCLWGRLGPAPQPCHYHPFYPLHRREGS